VIENLIKDRQKTHGDYALRAELSIALQDTLIEMSGNWNRLTPAEQEAVQMICVKLSRIMHGNPHCADHWRDIAGYATLVADYLDR